jgi:hypothetical protein
VSGGIDRRGLLKGAAVAGSLVAGPLAARGLRRDCIVVFDSSLAESRVFARGQRAREAFDLADARASRFAALRSLSARGANVEGLTRWSDLVALRRELGRQGLRLRSETRTRAGLFRWSMG